MKYLNIDKGYKLVARVNYKGKSFVVWSGYDRLVGEKVATKIQLLMNQGISSFLDWYDNDMHKWMTKNNIR